jgi:hypothetical protein
MKIICERLHSVSSAVEHVCDSVDLLAAASSRANHGRRRIVASSEAGRDASRGTNTNLAWLVEGSSSPRRRCSFQPPTDPALRVACG